MINSGCPSARKIRLLAIAPTSTPSCAAASAAVRAEDSRIRTSPVTPAAASADVTRSVAELICISHHIAAHIA